MSKTAKIIIVIIIVAIAIGIYRWYASRPVNPSGFNNIGANEQTPSGANTSDAALGQDLSAIDTQLSGLGGDTANISSSINDQPITQSNL